MRTEGFGVHTVHTPGCAHTAHPHIQLLTGDTDLVHSTMQGPLTRPTRTRETVVSRGKGTMSLVIFLTGGYAILLVLYHMEHP